jgi:predicted O-methyltransferase YrrM
MGDAHADIDYASLSLSRDEIEATIAPFLVERWTKSDPGFRARRGRQLRKFRFRRAKRILLGWLPQGKRTQRYVEDSYNETFAARPWPETNAAPGSDAKPTLADWGDEGLLVRRYGLGRVHLLLMARIIRAMGARNVLEVGSGTGINMFVLAALVPEARFTGVELTETGVRQAQTVVEAEEFPRQLAEYCPEPVRDMAAHRRVKVIQGNAVDLPFERGSFDLVFTRQALEQMDMIRDEALAEIARVASDRVLLVEPFADAQTDGLRQTYVAAKDYFSLPVEGLRRFGIAPVHRTRAFPQNTTLGIELVAARRTAS